MFTHAQVCALAPPMYVSVQYQHVWMTDLGELVTLCSSSQRGEMGLLNYSYYWKAPEISSKCIVVRSSGY